ncbi:hypothetical protein F4054_09660 [Candidatus Poribacteria bacterium]|nr:hypothetical protein [Candidatus Poribacteria bacterium]
MRTKQLERDLDGSEEELNDDDREAEFNDDDLPLFYHPSHRDILKLSVQHNLTATDLNTYSYIALNYDVLRAQSHAIKTQDIADFLGKKLRTLQLSISKQKDIGLLVEKGFNQNGTIYALPYREKAREDAHDLRVLKREKKIAEEVDLLVAEREAAVKRELYPYEIAHIREHIEKKYKVSSNGKHTNGSKKDLPEVEEIPFS